MSGKPVCEAELRFPVRCHMKVIADDRAQMAFVIETVLMELGLAVPVTRGNVSAGGKFVTYNFSFTAESREQMEQVDREMRAIVGVRMVL